MHRIAARLLYPLMWVISIIYRVLALPFKINQHFLPLIRVMASFEPRESDIYIVSYPKSGTTWVQQILYQLKTGGDMTFSHIAKEIPHIEEPRLHQTLETLEAPRIFKTHLTYKQIPKKGKYICVLRHGMDVAVSYYHHYLCHNEYQHSFDHFYRKFLAGKVAFGSWFEHVRDWRLNAEQRDVLYIFFEDLLTDLEGNLRKIAAFTGLPLQDENMPRLLEYCSFSYMKDHQIQFDLGIVFLLELGFRPGHFIRKGEKEQWREVLKGPAEADFRQRFDASLKDANLERYRTCLE